MSVPRVAPPPVAPTGAARRAPSWQLRARSRQVLDQAAAPLIPLRPLTVTEVMDAAFLLVRRNVGSMLGVPAALALAATAYVGLMTLIVTAVGNTTWRFAPYIVLGLGGLLGMVAFGLVVTWLQFHLSHACLRTVFGDDVSAARQLSWRQRFRLLGPAIAYLCYVYIVSSVVSTAVTIVFYVGLFGTASLAGSASDPTTLIVGMALTYSVALLLAVWSMSWVSLVIPIYVAEAEVAPDWIGRPTKQTNILGAIGRNFTLLGWKNSFRMMAANLGAMLGLQAIAGIVTLGVSLLVQQYATMFYLDLHPGEITLIVGVCEAVVMLLAGVLFSAYFAAVQLVFYLDLRMRREGLDLAMRFRVVPVPEPGQLGVL